MKAKTPSFVTEVPLAVDTGQERTLLVRFDAARQVYNACLGEALRRLDLVRQSKQFRRAGKIPRMVNGKPNKDRARAFADANAVYRFREYDLHAYAVQYSHSWLGEHLEGDALNAGLAIQLWPRVDYLLQAALSAIQATSARYLPASFGLNRRQSCSLAEVYPTNGKVLDGVAHVIHDVSREPERAVVTVEPPASRARNPARARVTRGSSQLNEVNMMYQPRRTIAVHPGEILQEILDQNQITQSQVAQRLTMAQSKINEICRGKRGVTPDMAMRLGKLFGQNPLFWLNLQKNWELSQLDESVYAGIEPFQMAL